MLLPGPSFATDLPAGFAPEEGLVLFQSLERSPLVNPIEGATASPFSHCGILHRTDRGWGVIEAVGPVRQTPLLDWIGQARDDRVVASRIREPLREAIPRFIAAAPSYAGRPYDLHYRFDDDAIDCSELVFKAFRSATGQALVLVQAFGDLDWKPYLARVEQIEQGPVPVERRMITPRAISEAAQLEKVFEG